MKQKSLVKELENIRVSDALIWVLDADEEYSKDAGKAKQAEDDLFQLGLSKKQKRAVNRLIQAMNCRNYDSIHVAYRLGFQDALELLAELNGISDVAKLCVECAGKAA